MKRKHRHIPLQSSVNREPSWAYTLLSRAFQGLRHHHTTIYTHFLNTVADALYPLSRPVPTAQYQQPSSLLGNTQYMFSYWLEARSNFAANAMHQDPSKERSTRGKTFQGYHSCHITYLTYLHPQAYRYACLRLSGSHPWCMIGLKI